MPRDCQPTLPDQVQAVINIMTREIAWYREVAAKARRDSAEFGMKGRFDEVDVQNRLASHYESAASLLQGYVPLLERALRAKENGPGVGGPSRGAAFVGSAPLATNDNSVPDAASGTQANR